jgi:hypothetical protein
MEFRFNNIRQISYQIFINVLKEKSSSSLLLQAVLLIKWHQLTLFSKWLNCIVQPRFIIKLRVSQIFPIPAVKSATDKEYLQCQILNIIASIHFLRKSGVFLNSGSHEMFFHFTVGFEFSAILTPATVLMPCHKQHFVHLYIYIYIYTYIMHMLQILSDNCCKCFGHHQYPFSGAKITVTTASGNRYTVLLSAAIVEYLESVRTLPR